MTELLVVASLVDQKNKQEEAADQTKKLNAVSRKQASDNAVRERRNQIRQQRIATAQIENAAAQSGQSGSSAVIAGVSGVQSQANQNIAQVNETLGYNNLQNQIKQNIFDLQQPNDLQFAASTIKTVQNDIFKTASF